MASFWDLFNGSEFYAKRARYRREFFQKASTIAARANLACQLETSHQTLPLSPQEAQILATHKDGFALLRARYLAGTLGSFAIQGGQIHLERKGLRYFTDLLAEHKARFESGYAMDLVSGKQIGIWVAQFIGALALTFWLGGSGVLAVISAVTSTLAAMLNDIQKIGQSGQATALRYMHYTLSTTTALVHERNVKLGGKKALQEGKSEIFQGYANYASQARYESRAAGTQTYQPSQPYAPSYAQTHDHATNEHLAKLDEITQGRSHYTLAGNAGFFDAISPQIPLAQIQELENDITYKQNSLNEQSKEIYEVLYQMSEYAGSSKEYSASEYFQALYDYNFLQKEQTYHIYAQSKDFIANIKAYNYALRANTLPYSILLEKSKSTHTRTKALAHTYDNLAHKDFSDISPAPLPPEQELQAQVQLTLYQELKQSGVSDEKASEIAYGSDDPEQTLAHEQAYKNAYKKYLQSCDEAKFVQALKGYDLLTNYASKILDIDKILKTEIFAHLQELYTQGYKEMLVHRVLELDTTLHASTLNATQAQETLKQECGSVFVYHKGQMERIELECRENWVEHATHTPTLPRKRAFEIARYFYHTSQIPYAKAQSLALSKVEYLLTHYTGDSDPYYTLELGDLSHTLFNDLFSHTQEKKIHAYLREHTPMADFYQAAITEHLRKQT